jgi:uncharacterized membrane protein YozB (DUF420 family)
MATLVARPVRGLKRADDIFFTTMSFLMLAVVVVGFAQSYFLRGAVFAHLPSLLVHLHGAVFSSWIILFLVQSGLVTAGNNRKVHKRLMLIANCMLLPPALSRLAVVTDHYQF